MAYSRVCPTRVWRTLEYRTTKEECTLKSKSCLESVAAPTPARRVTYMYTEGRGTQNILLRARGDGRKQTILGLEDHVCEGGNICGKNSHSAGSGDDRS